VGGPLLVFRSLTGPLWRTDAVRRELGDTGGVQEAVCGLCVNPRLGGGLW